MEQLCNDFTKLLNDLTNYLRMNRGKIGFTEPIFSHFEKIQRQYALSDLNKPVYNDKVVKIDYSLVSYNFQIEMDEEDLGNNFKIKKQLNYKLNIYFSGVDNNILNRMKLLLDKLSKSKIKKIKKMIFDFNNSNNSEFYRYKKLYKRLVKILGFFYSDWNIEHKHPDINKIPTKKELRNQRINYLLK